MSISRILTSVVRGSWRSLIRDQSTERAGNGEGEAARRTGEDALGKEQAGVVDQRVRFVKIRFIVDVLRGGKKRGLKIICPGNYLLYATVSVVVLSIPSAAV